MSTKKQIIRKLLATVFVIAFMAVMLNFAIETLLMADIFDPLLKTLLLCCTGILCFACAYFLYCKIYEVVAIIKNVKVDGKRAKHIDKTSTEIKPTETQSTAYVPAKSREKAVKNKFDFKALALMKKHDVKPQKQMDKTSEAIKKENTSVQRQSVDKRAQLHKKQENEAIERARREEEAIKALQLQRQEAKEEKTKLPAMQGAFANDESALVQQYYETNDGEAQSAVHIEHTAPQKTQEVVQAAMKPQNEQESSELAGKTIVTEPPDLAGMKLSRGRPPKEVTEARKAAKEAELEYYARLGIEPPKPRRGRPPKAEKAEKINEQTVLKEPTKLAEAVKPQKLQDEQKNKQLTKDELKIIEPEILAGMKLSRGRPPKEVTEARKAAKEAELAHYQELGIEPPKPRRGRPPKAKPE
ncbi:MAG: hypothetical protein RR424_09010 [Oscillospiraceae bacterium]